MNILSIYLKWKVLFITLSLTYRLYYTFMYIVELNLFLFLPFQKFLYFRLGKENSSFTNQFEKIIIIFMARVVRIQDKSQKISPSIISASTDFLDLNLSAQETIKQYKSNSNIKVIKSLTVPLLPYPHTYY